MHRIFVLNRLALIAGILRLVSRESAFPAQTSRPAYPVHPVNPCFLSLLQNSAGKGFVGRERGWAIRGAGPPCA